MPQANTTHVLSQLREVQVSRPSDLVVEQLMKLIGSGVLKPGELLPPERELTKRFSISRIYVREGIKTLELYGMLKPTQGKGTVVVDSGIRGLEGVLKKVLKLSRNEFRALLDTRILLETHTARLAAEREDIQGKQELLECLEEMRRENLAGRGLVNDLRLHMKIADLSGNSVVSSLVRLITPDIMMNYRDMRQDNTALSFDVHRSIVECIVAGDADHAATLMHEHLSYSKRNYEDAVDWLQSVESDAK